MSSDSMHSSGAHSILDPLYGLIKSPVSAFVYGNQVKYLLATHHAGARETSRGDRIGANVAIKTREVYIDDDEIVDVL